MTTTFIIYRNNGSGELRQRIKQAVTDFYSEWAKLPTAMIVHKSEVADAQAALQALDLALEMRGSGGCLIGEVWLKLPKNNSDEGEGS